MAAKAAEKSRTLRVGGDRANLVTFLFDRVCGRDATTWVNMTEALKSSSRPPLQRGPEYHIQAFFEQEAKLAFSANEILVL